MKYDIFISYRRNGGSVYTRPLQLALEKLGYRVFLDFDELKDGVFDKRITDAIDEAPIFLIILSAHSLDRCKNEDDWVRKEIEYALEKNRHIIPINPNKEFDGFPENIPLSVKKGVGQHQFSHIDFEQLFKASFDKLVSERIEPLLSHISHLSKKQGALVRVDSDLKCRILVFGKEIGVACCGLTEIRLQKGKHKISFIGIESDAERYDCIVDIRDLEYEEYIEVRLLDKYDSRKAEERRIQAETEKRQVVEWIALGNVSYEKGDYKEAVKWFQKAAEIGNAEAQCNLGYCYQEGLGLTIDTTTAVKWYQKAAKREYAKAQRLLGYCFEKGIGIAKDLTEAAKWLRKAAEQGDTIAQNNLGIYYKFGFGVPKDLAVAVKWHRKAAELGYDEAQYALGRCYEYGTGITTDQKEAITWYLKAAKQGHKEAQCHLGYCYEYGIGVDITPKEAFKWYSKAAEQGDSVAKSALTRFKNGNKRVYSIGDFYNENGKSGIVFWVDQTRQHGKILSLKQSVESLSWASDKTEYERLINAHNSTDGAYNMAKVTAIQNWQNKYPAFRWCADLGDGWYLPAIDELRIFASKGSTRDTINRALKSNRGEELTDSATYWSSTEKGEFSAWCINDINVDHNPKYSRHHCAYVRAVSKF